MKAWYQSAECHHLCWLMADMSKWPATQRQMPRIAGQYVAAFLKPQLVAAGCKGALHIINCESGAIINSTQLADRDVQSVVFAPCGQLQDEEPCRDRCAGGHRNAPSFAN